ncbi:MAG: hypothetical protein PHV74_11420 [Dehalococcoidia bacterium]|nr:hypothetical protein [Dehalococcoidia bacterium]
MNQPTNRDWANLYQSAMMFKEAAPWDWVHNDTLFAVENPDDGEVSYCSILGSGGEEFGLGMFIGDKGYESHLRVMGGEIDPADYFEIMMMSRSITMFLTDREDLEKRDRDVIRSLGLRFRGRNAWPLFRSQQPGYAPWFLEEGEAVFLTTAIRQALVMAEEIRNGRLDLLKGSPDNLVLTRYCHGGNWGGEWRNTPVLSPNDQACAESIDTAKEAELYLLQNRGREHSGVWELDIFMLPVPIGMAAEKPYFPICFLVVDCRLGLIVGANLTEPWITFSEKQEELIRIFGKAKQLPGEVRVKSDKVRRILEPITGVLGIKLRVTSVPSLEEAKAGLLEQFA